MLQPADAAVVRRDPALPGLALLLDPERLHTALTSAVGDCGLAPAVVEYLRYKPGQSCLAACRTALDGRDVVFSAKAYRPDASDKLRKRFETPSTPGLLGSGRFLLDGGVVVSVFPNDSRLSTLARLDAPALLAGLRRRSGTGARPADAAAEIQTLRFNPERRFVGRLTAAGEIIASLRCYTAADFERASGKAGSLRSRGSLRLARLLRRVARWRLLVMEWLEGELLHDAIRQGTASHDTMQAVGEALAELHAQSPRALPREPGRCDPATLRALAHGLAVLDPDVARQARPLADHLAARLLAPPDAACPVHGDFHAQQVLLHDDGVALLDLDEVAWGDPASDLGRFTADLERRVIGGALDGDRARSLTEGLLEGYERAAGGLPPRLNLHVAIELLRLSPHPFRRRAAGWTEMTAALLDAAQAFLKADERAEQTRKSLSSGRGRSRVSDPFDVLRDSRMPFLVQALDPSAMAECFTRALPCTHGPTRVEVRRISVMRHKPGRRCVIEYFVAAHGWPHETALVGKCRARGADVSTYSLCDELWRGSFGPDAADGISVPEPVCVLPAVHMTVQRKVSGEPLWPLLSGEHGIHMAHRAAEAIHKLHRTAIPPCRAHSIGDELSILKQRLAATADARPSWAARLAAVVDGCVRLARRLPPPDPCGIHRDFYPDQLLSDGRSLWLVDLDLYSEGDPALDVGNFAAHTDEYAVRSGGGYGHWAPRTRAFVDRYLDLSGRTAREAIDVYTTLALARHIAISMQLAERRPFTEALLESCEERLSGMVPAWRESR